MSSVLFSVVICTYNRSRLLAEAVRSVCRQTLAREDYEIIVVDNNSTDSTKNVVDEIRAEDSDVIYLLEPEPGLSHARNAGWRRSAGAYVAYIDDDCRVPPGWLLAAKEIVHGLRPEVFGGPIRARFESRRPRWLKEEYASRDWGEEPRMLDEGDYLGGGNLFVLREALKNVGGFDANLGMTKEIMAYGEDSDLQKRIRRGIQGSRIYYDPGVFVWHLFRADKVNIRWFFRERFLKGRYWVRVGQANPEPGTTKGRLVRDMTWVFRMALKECLAGLVKRDRKKYPYFQNYVIEVVLPRIQKLGELWESVKHI